MFWEVGYQVLRGIVSPGGLAVKDVWQAMRGKAGVPMENITFEADGSQLVIVIDLSRELGFSKSGKSVIIATTSGNVSLPGHEEIEIGLNVYRPIVAAARPARR